MECYLCSHENGRMNVVTLPRVDKISDMICFLCHDNTTAVIRRIAKQEASARVAVFKVVGDGGGVMHSKIVEYLLIEGGNYTKLQVKRSIHALKKYRQLETVHDDLCFTRNTKLLNQLGVPIALTKKGWINYYKITRCLELRYKIKYWPMIDVSDLINNNGGDDGNDHHHQEQDLF